jgi:hypothetical protein
LLFVLLACSPLVWSQGRLGAPTTSVTASFTLSVTGGGTGTVTSGDGQISLCSSGGGTCSGTYLIGSTVVLTPTASGGSLFAWSTGTDGASVCAGAGACTFVITANATLVGIFSGSGAGAIQASPYFSIDLNSASQYPSGGSCSGTFQNCINQGQNRFWDTPNVTVPFLETCDNGTFICTSTHVVYTFNAANGFDALLATMNSNSVHTAQMALARMPVFASSKYPRRSCNYYSTFTPAGDRVRFSAGITTVTTSGATLFSTGSAWVGSVLLVADSDFGVTERFSRSTRHHHPESIAPLDRRTSQHDDLREFEHAAAVPGRPVPASERSQRGRNRSEPLLAQLGREDHSTRERQRRQRRLSHDARAHHRVGNLERALGREVLGGLARSTDPHAGRSLRPGEGLLGFALTFTAVNNTGLYTIASNYARIEQQPEGRALQHHRLGQSAETI